MHALRRGKVFAPTSESKKRKRDLGCLSRPLLLPSAAEGGGRGDGEFIAHPPGSGYIF